MKTTITRIALGLVLTTALSACSLIPSFSSEPQLGAALGSSYGEYDSYEAESLTVSGVLFEPGKATLQSGADDIVSQTAAWLESNPDSRVLIEGHTDHVGPKSDNKKLSEQRALAVARALLDEGISVDRITAFGSGETRPVADNSTSEGRAENRRVDIIFAQ